MKRKVMIMLYLGYLVIKMNKIPPVVGLLIALVIGLLLGTFSTYQYYTKDLLEKEAEVRTQDREKDKDITKETLEMQTDTTLADTIAGYKKPKQSQPLKRSKSKVKPKVRIEYVDKLIPATCPIPIICPELTENEIINMCVTQYVPADILQPLRDQIDRARRRTNADLLPSP